MKTLTFLLLTLVFAPAAFSQVLTDKELAVLEGEKWTGTLTYLDYSSNKKTSIKSNVTISRNPTAVNVWTFDYDYPDEPKANSTALIKLEDGGRKFSDAKIVDKIISGETLVVSAVKDGTDNKRKAVFRFIYTITPKTFSIRKDVQYEGKTEWFERNTYSWTR